MILREMLADFNEHNLPVSEPSGGRYGTDDASFVEKGIPTLGLYTGADRPKSEADARLFGGVAGRPNDPCYHQACDTVDNINRDVLEENARVLMRAVTAVASAMRRGVSVAPAEPKPKSMIPKSCRLFAACVRLRW